MIRPADPATKKKRTPKPFFNYGTHILPEFIPFLNCDPDKPGEMIGHIISRLETWARVNDDFIWRWAEKVKIVEGLRETQSDIKTLLVDPINQPIIDRMNRFISGLSPVVKDYNPNYKCLTMNLCPRESDDGFSMNTQGLRDFDRIWVPGFRGMLYAITAEAFEVADFTTEKPNVFFYIGRCPKCGIVFEKKRGDQEYCSNSCRTSAGVERLRKKSK